MMKAARVIIPHELWRSTWSGLHAKSSGTREAACVWSGSRDSADWYVKSVFFLDDLGPVDAGALYHRASRECVAHLFSALRQRGEVIIGDVHTHPDEWVDLSPTDREHPIEFRVGLLAFVVPHFARGRPAVHELGAHEYTGTSRWRRLSSIELFERLLISE